MTVDMDLLRLNLMQYALPILVFFAIAYMVHRISNPLARRLRPIGDFTMRDNPRRAERLQTLQALISSMVSIIAFIVATLASLTLFVSADTLLWVFGLFSAAFGLGARPFIADFLTGVSFIFEDTFDVGDKIDIPLYPQRVEGVVERVTLRVTQVRGMDGELFTMPNGDIRLVRNFSRGTISRTRVVLKVPSGSVSQTLELLENLAEPAMTRLPNLVEPWQVISEAGELGEEAELTVLAKAKFGKGADLRTHMMALLQDELAGLGILPRIEKPEPKFNPIKPDADPL